MSTFRWYCSLCMVWESVFITFALFALFCYPANASTSYLFRISLQCSLDECYLSIMSFFSLVPNFHLCCVDVPSVEWFCPVGSIFLRPEDQGDQCFLCSWADKQHPEFKDS